MWRPLPAGQHFCLPRDGWVLGLGLGAGWGTQRRSHFSGPCGLLCAAAGLAGTAAALIRGCLRPVANFTSCPGTDSGPGGMEVAACGQRPTPWSGDEPPVVSAASSLTPGPAWPLRHPTRLPGGKDSED